MSVLYTITTFSCMIRTYTGQYCIQVNTNFCGLIFTLIRRNNTREKYVTLIKVLFVWYHGSVSSCYASMHLHTCASYVYTYGYYTTTTRLSRFWANCPFWLSVNNENKTQRNFSLYGILLWQSVHPACTYVCVLQL